MACQVEEGQPPAALPSSGPPRQTVTDDEGNTVTLSLDIKSVKPYRTQDEYLYAMKEDLAEWFNALYDLPITVDDFFEQLETGVVLCQHANALQNFIARQLDDDKRGSGECQGLPLRISNNRYPVQLPSSLVVFRSRVQPGSFQSRDNISNFIAWCRQVLVIPDTLLFETEDLVSRKNERNVVLCVLEVARRGASYGMLAPKLVQFEAEIDAEMAEDEEEEGQGGDGAKKDYNKNQQLLQQTSQAATAAAAALRKQKPWIEVDMMSLDEMVRLILSACTCEHQFPMVRVSEGKYRFGESMSLIFLRILRNHVMVRIGGGWDTLECFLDRYDPCRCKSKEHRGTMAFATKPTPSSHATEQQKPLVAATLTSLSCPSQHHSTVETNNTTQAKDSPSVWAKGNPQKHLPPSKETQHQQQPEKSSKPRSQEQTHPPLKPKPKNQSPLHTAKRPESRPGPGQGPGPGTGTGSGPGTGTGSGSGTGPGQGPGTGPGPVNRRSPSPVPSSSQPSKSQGIQGNRSNGPVKPSVAKRLDTRPSSASPSLARANKTFRSSGDLLSSNSRTPRGGNSPTRGQSPINNNRLVRTGSSSTVLDTDKKNSSSSSTRSGSGVGRGASRSATPSGSLKRSNSMDSTKLTSSPFRPKNPRPATAAVAVNSSTGQQRPLSKTNRTKSIPNVVPSKSTVDNNKRRVTTGKSSAQLTKASSRSSGNLTQKLRLGITADRLLPSYGRKKWTGDCRSSSLDVSPTDEDRVLRGIDDDDVDDAEHPSRMRRSASLQPSASFTLLHIDDYPDPAPPEDEDMNARMEELFEQYRDIELRQTFPVAGRTDKKQTDKKYVSGIASSKKKNPSAAPSSTSFSKVVTQGRCRSRERVDGSETAVPSRSLFRRVAADNNGDKQRSARTLCPSSAANTPPSDDRVSRSSSNRPTSSSSHADRGHKMVPRKESNSWSADQGQPRGHGSADQRLQRSSFDASSRSTDDDAAARPRSSSSWRPRNVLSKKDRTLSGSRESFIAVGGAGSLARRTGALASLSKSFGDISDIPMTTISASGTSGTQKPCCSEDEMPLNGCREGSDLNDLQINVDLAAQGDSIVKAKPRRDDRLGPPTRIPLPLVPGDQRLYDHSSGSLKRFDSGVDITNVSPTGDNGSNQGDEEEDGEAGSCRGWAISVQRSEARSLSDQKLVFAAPPQVEDEYY